MSDKNIIEKRKAVIEDLQRLKTIQKSKMDKLEITLERDKYSLLMTTDPDLKASFQKSIKETEAKIQKETEYYNSYDQQLWQRREELNKMYGFIF